MLPIRYRRIPGTVLALMLIMWPAARAAGRGGPGSSFGEALRLTNTAWAIAMSEAQVASAAGVTALSVNPAGMMDSAITTLHLTHVVYVQGINEDYLAYVQRLPFDAALGAGVHGLYDSSTARTLEDAAGEYAGEAGAFPVAFGVGGVAFAMDLSRFLPQLSFLRPTGGIGLRFLAQQVDRDSWIGFTTDLGVRVKPGSGFMIGGVLQNVGLVQGKAGLPLQWVTGIGWRTRRVMAETDGLLLEVDLPLAVDRPLVPKIGFEYSLLVNKVAVAGRMGWKREAEVPGASAITSGLGFRWMMGITPWGLDYAHVPWGILGRVHAISVTVGLVPKVEPSTPMPSLTRDQRAPYTVFYPRKGEIARYTAHADRATEVSAVLLDENGHYIMTLFPRTQVEAGPVEITWDGRLPTGWWAKFELTYRMMIEVGPATYYQDVIPRKE